MYEANGSFQFLEQIGLFESQIEKIVQYFG